jgi:ABC-type uncharacterized transport system permease subunit
MLAYPQLHRHGHRLADLASHCSGRTSPPSEPNNQLVFVTPYVVTLVAVSVGAQRLRPPAEEGIPWFKGQL